MSAAWPYAVRVADAYSRHGWPAAVRGVENGGRVEGLPARAAPADDGASAPECPTEIAISERRQYELSSLGFLPLLHARGRGVTMFMGAQSCRQPQVYDDPAATASDELSARIDLQLCASRFLHYLKVMARDKIHTVEEVSHGARWLNLWIKGYVRPDPENTGPEMEARKPLQEARIELVGGPGRPGGLRIHAYLRPRFQLETLTVGILLRTEAPHVAAIRPAAINPAWLRWNDGAAARLARAIREQRRFVGLPILADALEEAGCSDQRILGHCREGAAGHQGGCWVLDALLAKE
jgi:type VI secretion system protein ImpC